MKKNEEQGMDDIAADIAADIAEDAAEDAAEDSAADSAADLMPAQSRVAIGVDAAGDADSTPAAEQTGMRAAFWLAEFTNELGELQSKWQAVDGEFKSREARIAELHAEIARRDEALARLAEELRQNTAAGLALEDALAAKTTEIADLQSDLQAREAQIDELAAAAARTADENAGSAQTLASAKAQAARLQAELERERGTVAQAQERNEALLAEQAVLQARVQDLEVYVEGRKQHWAELHARIAEYEDTIAGMGKTLKSKEGATAQHHEEKQKLAVRVLELERQAAELLGRRKEREAAYADLERKLAEQTELAQRIKAEYATRSQEAQGVLTAAEESRKLVDSLERGIERRDEALAALRAELESERSAYADLDRVKAKLERRGGEIEQLIDDRARQVQGLREELRAANEHLKLAETELEKRVAELREHREQAGDGSRRIEELEGELTRLGKANANLLVRIESTESRVEELERERDSACAETERVTQELNAQQDVIASLEAELGRKPRPASISIEADDDDFDSLDFAATLAAEDAQDRTSEELLPIEALLSDEDLERSWVAEIGKLSPRKLVAHLSGENVDYPLTKTEMTIGRGKHSDIRIASHFISRIHATIKTQGAATVIEDAGSKNGILVNSSRVERCVLRDGDIVSLGGELDLRFVDARH